jgi:hypothetical protein
MFNNASLCSHLEHRYARSENLEITGLEQWMEGPMLINNVSVINNTFVGTADGDHNVHPSSQVIASLPCVLNRLIKKKQQ